MVLGFVSLQFPGAGSSRRSATGLDDDKSCAVDVEDELVPELDDNPGTTRFAHSRIGQNRERKLVLPRLFALFHRPLLFIVGFLDLRRVSSSSELQSLLQCMNRRCLNFNTRVKPSFICKSVFFSATRPKSRSCRGVRCAGDVKHGNNNDCAWDMSCKV